MTTRAVARDCWIFDLDNTLYPAEATIYDDIGVRMTAYIARLTGLDAIAAEALREDYFHAYGATVVGLIRHHGCDPNDFMRDVHEIAIHDVGPDEGLNARIRALPGRRFVFTNGASEYARRIVALIGLHDAFERIVSLEDIDFAPKPTRASFEAMLTLCEIDPRRATMFEDHPANLDTAAALGMRTVLVGPAAVRGEGARFDCAAPTLLAAIEALSD